MDPLLSMIVRIKLKSTKHSAQSQAHSKQMSSGSYYYSQGMMFVRKRTMIQVDKHHLYLIAFL